MSLNCIKTFNLKTNNKLKSKIWREFYVKAMCDKKESTFFRDRILQISLNQILKKTSQTISQKK